MGENEQNRAKMVNLYPYKVLGSCCRNSMFEISISCGCTNKLWLQQATMITSHGAFQV